MSSNVDAGIVAGEHTAGESIAAAFEQDADGVSFAEASSADCTAGQCGRAAGLDIDADALAGDGRAAVDRHALAGVDQHAGRAGGRRVGNRGLGPGDGGGAPGDFQTGCVVGVRGSVLDGDVAGRADADIAVAVDPVVVHDRTAAALDVEADRVGVDHVGIVVHAVAERGASAVESTSTPVAMPLIDRPVTVPLAASSPAESPNWMPSFGVETLPA